MAFYMPTLTVVPATREMIGEFRGYNHNLRISANEFFSTQNLTSDLYPLISPRKPRGRVRQFEKPNGLFAHNKLCWVDGTGMYYDGHFVGTVEDSPKQFVSMGAFILVWPDKVFYNTKTGEYGSLGNKTTTAGAVSITLCKADGTPYGEYTTSDAAPESPTNGQLWVDTSSTPHVLKIYSAAQATWSSVPTTYAKISATGIGKGFAEYDGVTITGITDYPDLNGSHVLYGVGDDYIVIIAILDAVATQTESVIVERVIPDMDYITESENRIWGCSSANHEIYACAQGDPKNWNRFLGIATDSYAMTVGSNGDFTGAVTHLGYVLFFKEDAIHKIYGNKPANYQLSSTNSRGVERGSEKSLVIVNETLYYKSRNDVCAFNSALPSSISDALGKGRYTNAVAGARGSKYYISMQDALGTGIFLAYDENLGVWHREDDVYAPYFAALGPELYFISGQDNCLYSVGGTIADYADTEAALEKRVDWSFETGDIGIDSPDNKYISKLQIRLEVGEKALMRIEVRYNGESEWEEKYRINMAYKQSFTAPVIPRRCDTMRLRFSGYGDFKIYSITKTIEQGSDA